MMVWHHAFYGGIVSGYGMPYLGIPFQNQTIEYFLGGGFLVFIVGMFAFVSGYGLSAKYRGKPFFECFKGCLKSLAWFLILNAAILLVVFTPFEIAKAVRDGSFDFSGYFLSFIGIGNVNDFNWYTWLYALLALSFPVINLFASKTSLRARSIAYFSILATFFALIILFYRFIPGSKLYSSLQNFLSLYPVFLGASLFHDVAKIIDKRVADTKKNRFIFCSISFVVCLGILVFLAFYRQPFVFLLRPFAVFAIVIFINAITPPIAGLKTKKVLTILSSFVVYVWLVHWVVFSPTVNLFIPLREIVYFAKIPLLIEIVIIAVSALISTPIYFLFYFLKAHSKKKKEATPIN